MRMKPRGEDRPAPLGDPPRHDDRLPTGGRAVIHGGIGDIRPEQARDLGLELKQHLQRALRDFRLIRRVGGQELAALDDRVNAGWDMMTIGPCPQEERRICSRQILLRQRAHMLLDRHLAGVHWQPANRAIQPRFFRYIDKQIVDVARTDFGKHFAAIGIGQG